MTARKTVSLWQALIEEIAYRVCHYFIANRSRVSGRSTSHSDTLNRIGSLCPRRALNRVGTNQVSILVFENDTRGNKGIELYLLVVAGAVLLVCIYCIQDTYIHTYTRYALDVPLRRQGNT